MQRLRMRIKPLRLRIKCAEAAVDMIAIGGEIG
jgi:hypothetical protein